MKLPYDTGILLLHICPREQKNTCSHGNSSLIYNSKKVETIWISLMGQIEYYVVIKGNEILTHLITLINLKIIILSAKHRDKRSHIIWHYSFESLE